MRGAGRCVLVAALALALSSWSVGDHGLELGTAVQAGGGGSGKEEGAAPKDKQPKPAKKKAHVPDTDDLRATKGPQAKMHDRLEDYAGEDGLAGLATSLPRLKKFRKALDRLIARAKTSQQKEEANNILSQLRRYRNQKKNKPLGANANRILKSLIALEAHDRVVVAEKAYYKTTLTKGIGDDIEANVDYEDAVKDYNAALKNVPKVPRNQFERFDKTLLPN